MATKQTTIDGYTVDLDTDMDGDGKVTGCWISRPRGNYSASLEALLAEGVLTRINPGGEYEEKVEESTIEKIEKWAEENGY